MSTMLYLLVSVIAFAITAALGKWMIPFLHIVSEKSPIVLCFPLSIL